MLTDENGDTLMDVETTPFGDQDEKGLFYTGKQWDEDVELYYFNARWYDPETARFITEDPVKDGLLWFAYVNNNPMGFVDPTGLRKKNKNKPIRSEEERQQRINDKQRSQQQELEKDSREEQNRFFQDPDNSWIREMEKKIFNRVEKLIAAQDEAMTHPSFQPGAKGPNNWQGAPADATWCHQAAYQIAKKMGFSMRNFVTEETGSNFGIITIGKATEALEVNARDPNVSLQRITDPNEASRLAAEYVNIVEACSLK